ncbi:sensor histidine kinase [Streptomyces sp. NPDC001678]|uniref:sensor histidine kinase n=1 Tax=Streptomyces sp. NPDC001678 TaxID=3364599 RepID=UPI0036837882
MDSSVAIGQPGGRSLGTVLGGVFAEALQEGLARAIRASDQRTLRRPRSPSATTATRDPIPAVLPKDSADAILDRFSRSLPSALLPDDSEVPALHRGLTTFARHILTRAATPGPHTPSSAPPVIDASPHHLATGTVLLLESALLHLLESATSDSRTGLAQGVALVRTLGKAMCATAGDAWAGDHGWNERRRLARQLHDGLGSTLAIALHRIELSEEDPGSAAAHLAAAKTALDDAVHENHALISGLRRHAEVPPLREALEAFVNAARPAARVTIIETGNETLASDRCRRELFLVLREALRNSLKHAQAEHIEVTLRTTRRWLFACVADNGVGFRTDAVPGRSRTAHGLSSMAERIEELGGRLRIDSSPGGGTRLQIHLPLQP